MSALRGQLTRRGDGARSALLVLIAAGVMLRVLAALSWWPVSPNLQDGYELFAAHPFADSLHPPGYAIVLWLLGRLSRDVAVLVVLQHLAGIASALLLWAATSRVTGSRWAGLLPAAGLLLGADEIRLEHAVMSESWAILAIAVALYAAVRAGEAPGALRWPLLSGLALAAAVTIRTASLPFVAVAVLALLVWPGGPLGRRARSALATAATTAIVLLALAAASSSAGHPFAIAPSPGWYLYGRVAQFADCRQFTPPPGTRALCQREPPARRPTGYFYEFEPGSPAIRRFGAFGRYDSVLGGWARRALLAQPGAFLATAWGYLRAYYVPSWLPARLRSASTELDPQLDFTATVNPFYEAAGIQQLHSWFGGFRIHTWSGGLRLLHAWQRVVRFGAVALLITTVLTLLGLCLGSPRRRAGVLLFGVGGLALLLAPVLTGTYAGRYTVPMAGPLLASAAIALASLADRVRAHRAARGRVIPGTARPDVVAEGPSRSVRDAPAGGTASIGRVSGEQ